MASPVLFKMDSKPAAAAASRQTKLTGNQTAPHLHPNVDGPVDVVKDFQWTASYKEKFILDETPRIYLKEYEIVGNAIVQQAKYMSEFGVNFINEGGVKGVAAGAAGALAGGFIAGGQGAGYGAVAGAAAAGWLDRDELPASSRNKGYLESYKGLYNVAPTNFQYIFPFFEEEFRSTANQFQLPQASNSPVGSMVNNLRGNVANVLSDAALMFNEPNAYVEEAKTYVHATQGQSFNVKFELSNTLNYADVVRNWHLVYMLLYQNMGNRASKVLIRPPCIYEVEIPGVMYHPFCDISNLQITYKGASRRMDIDIETFGTSSDGTDNLPRSVGALDHKVTGHSKSHKMETIIPDAYGISMNITPLVNESKNMLYHTTTKNDDIYDIKVTAARTGGDTGQTG